MTHYTTRGNITTILCNKCGHNLRMTRLEKRLWCDTCREYTKGGITRRWNKKKN